MMSFEIYAKLCPKKHKIDRMTDAVRFANLLSPMQMPADVPFKRNFYSKLSFTCSNFALEKVEHMHTYVRTTFSEQN